MPTLCERDHLELSHWSKYWPWQQVAQEQRGATDKTQARGFSFEVQGSSFALEKSELRAGLLPARGLPACGGPSGSFFIVLEGTTSQVPAAGEAGTGLGTRTCEA